EGISSYGLSVAATSDQRHYGVRALFHRNMKKGDRAPRRQPPCSVPLWTVSVEKGSDPDYERYASRPRPCAENPCAGSTSCCSAYMHAAASSMWRTNSIDPCRIGLTRSRS